MTSIKKLEKTLKKYENQASRENRENELKRKIRDLKYRKPIKFLKTTGTALKYTGKGLKESARVFGNVGRNIRLAQEQDRQLIKKAVKRGRRVASARQVPVRDEYSSNMNDLLNL